MDEPLSCGCSSLERQIGEIRQGAHLCLLYEDEQAQMRAAVAYLADGLVRGEACLYIADERTVEQVQARLAAAGVDGPGERARGALAVLTGREAYLRSGRFDPAEMVDFLSASVEAAVRRGFAGLRVTGEMTWALGPEARCEGLLEYEVLLNRFFPGSRASAICQYNRHRFPPELIIEVLRSHPVVVLGERVCANVYYEPPELRSGGDAAARLDWMLGQLRRTRATAQRLESLNEHLVTQSAVLRAEVSRGREAEADLARHRDDLDELVQQRTAELGATHRRLRHAERMASLGTLSAGLGHDLGNLLVPVRVRLDSLMSADLPDGARADVEAIRVSTEHLQRLGTGLRLLAIDPRRGVAAGATDVGAWWDDVSAVMRNALPLGITLSARMPSSACWVGLSRAALAQAVFNLVQNAGEAMEERGSGSVTVWAETNGAEVLLGVTDDGPGMDEDVLRRCLEPFFTTKPRGLSTGMGLSLVYGLVQSAGGTVSIESAPGRGATFTLRLPAASPPDAGAGARPVGAVRLRDPRLRAFASLELVLLGFDVEPAEAGAADAEVVVTDEPSACRVRRGARVLVVGDASVDAPAVTRAPAGARVSELRAAIRRLVGRAGPGSGVDVGSGGARPRAYAGSDG